jgi:hypothetical protein
MSLRYEEKYDNKAVSEICYIEDKTRGDVSYYCLDYVLLRLTIMIEEDLDSKS